MEQVFKTEPRAKMIITVIDTGIGIAKDDKQKLFKLFGKTSQVAQDSGQGIGLGLTIANKIVKAFDGQIGLKSVKGAGSQFSFSFVLEQIKEI